MNRDTLSAPAVTPAGTQPGARPYLHTLEAGAKLPLLQSLVWAFVTCFGALVLVLSGRPIWPDALLWPAGGFVGGFALAWLAYQRHWFRLSSLERLTGLDLNGDGRIGEQMTAYYAPQSIRVQVDELTVDGHVRVSKLFDLPATQTQLASLAEGLFAGVTFAERNWTGAGHPFSIDGFRRLRSEMIKRGMLYTSDKSVNQGFQLTKAGMAVLRQFLPTPGEVQ